MKRLTLVLFSIVAGIIALLPSISWADVTVGSYNRSAETAIMLFAEFYGTGDYRKTGRELLWIDFKNEKTHAIAEGSDIGWDRVNRNGTRVAYLKGPSLLKIYDLKEEETIYEQNNGVDGIHFYWTENPDVLAGINAKNDTWFALNLQEDDYQEAKYTGQYLWGVSWLASCACVEFEVSDKSHTEHYVIHLVKGGIKKIESKEHISHSPDGRYTVFGKTSAADDGPNEFIVIDNKNNATQNYYARSPIDHEQILWGNGVVRILFDVALLNLETGELANPSMSSLWKDQRPRGKGIVPIDLAADPAGYVLRWDMDKKQFLVEDINAGGKIIKTYEKFWGNDAVDAKEESRAKKP